MSDKKEIPDYYGKGGRLKKEAHHALIETAYRHDLSDRETLTPFLHDADLAHAIALTEAEVIPNGNGKVLLQGLLQLEKDKGGFFDVDEKLGDLYNSKDKALRSLIGDDAGWLHAGRPRREAVNISYLLATKTKLVELATQTVSLGMIMARRCSEWKEVLMPDYTYLQPAHPTNLAHYLLTFVFPLLRDLKRYASLFDELSACPAGSGSTNGTRLPLDRKRLAQLLGFERCTSHSRDAMWQPDVPVHMAGALGAAMVNLDRFAEELQLWVTPAFDFASFDDGFFRSSVIMPHKRNPYAMAYIRGVTGWLSGQLASVVSLGKTYSGNPDSRFFIYGMIPEAIEKVTGCVRLISALVEGMEPNNENMLAALDEHFLQATDLADLIMLNGKVDYRSAHQLTGRIASDVAEGKIKISKITPEHISAVSKEVLGKELRLTSEEISSVLDHATLISSRKGIGAASIDRVTDQLTHISEQLQNFGDWAKKTTMEQQNTRISLRELARELSN